MVITNNNEIRPDIGAGMNQQGVVPPNVALDPSSNSVIGSANQPNLQNQTSAVNTIHQTIVTATSTVLTSTPSPFATPASHSTPNSDINSNVSGSRSVVLLIFLNESNVILIYNDVRFESFYTY